MTPASATPTAELLVDARAGDKDAFDVLYSRVYAELRPVARRQLAGQRRSATLDTTTLIHETYARLLEESLPAESRAHFLAIAARAMRRVIVDGARATGAQKRGGGRRPVTLPSDGGPGVRHDIETLVTIDQALSGLAAFNERLERVAECRLFGGLTDEETAAALGISVRTVQRDWPRARAWLQQHLGD
jgi:RNA polymerase sigma-70 factor, ECF subfamily